MKYVKVAVPDDHVVDKLKLMDGTVVPVWKPEYREVLDYGYVGLVDFMGDDQAIDDAARVSYGAGTRKVSELRSLIRYLLRHQHTTPFEMVEVKFHIKLPIFVARQWIRHRTANVNEYSARYSEMSDEFYMPEPDVIAPQSGANKQGRAGELSDNDKTAARQAMSEVYQVAYEAYEYLMGKQTMPPTSVQKFRLQLEGVIWERARNTREEYARTGEGHPLTDDEISAAIDNIEWKVFSEKFEGVSRELSRIVMPVGAYTQMYWKIDLHNLMHFLALRMDSHAQYEIRQYAQAMYDMVLPLVPEAMEAFRDYRLEGVRLSRQELQAIRSSLKAPEWWSWEDLAMASGLKGRELSEFKEKLES